MAGLKRTDNKGRILKDGETQRKDGTYRFTYTDADGVRHDVYSKRLVPTDRPLLAAKTISALEKRTKDQPRSGRRHQGCGRKQSYAQ